MRQEVGCLSVNNFADKQKRQKRERPPDRELKYRVQSSLHWCIVSVYVEFVNLLTRAAQLAEPELLGLFGISTAVLPS
jgi:hypothetical protein